MANIYVGILLKGNLSEKYKFIEVVWIQHFILQCFGGISLKSTQENLITKQHRDKLKDDY
jgi:hypothetical protein